MNEKKGFINAQEELLSVNLKKGIFFDRNNSSNWFRSNENWAEIFSMIVHNQNLHPLFVSKPPDFRRFTPLINLSVKTVKDRMALI